MCGPFISLHQLRENGDRQIVTGRKRFTRFEWPLRSDPDSGEDRREGRFPSLSALPLFAERPAAVDAAVTHMNMRLRRRG